MCTLRGAFRTRNTFFRHLRGAFRRRKTRECIRRLVSIRSFGHTWINLHEQIAAEMTIIIIFIIIIISSMIVNTGSFFYSQPKSHFSGGGPKNMNTRRKFQRLHQLQTLITDSLKWLLGFIEVTWSKQLTHIKLTFSLWVIAFLNAITLKVLYFLHSNYGDKIRDVLTSQWAALIIRVILRTCTPKKGQ